MADTKSSKSNKAKPKKAKKASTGAPGAKKTAKAAKGKAAKAKSAKSKASKPAKAAKGKAGNGGAAAAKASSNGGGAASTVGAVAEKAKYPLLATGAALAGAAAVIATKGVPHKQKKVLGVKVPKGAHLPKVKAPKVKAPKVKAPKVSMPSGKGLKGDVRRAAGAVTDAAEKADLIGKRISQVANSVQAVGEATDDAAKKS